MTAPRAPKAPVPIVHRFASMNALLETAGAPCEMSEDDRCSQLTGDHRAKFSGTGRYIDADYLARHGYSDIRPSIDALSADIVGRVADTIKDGFTYHYDVSGAEVDIGLYVAGEPECMLETRLEPMPARGKLVTILVSVTASAGVSADKILERGAAIVALVELLSHAGNHVEVWVTVDIEGKKPERADHHMSVLTCIKAAGDPLDIDAVSFAVAHPSFLRRIILALVEHGKVSVRRRFDQGLDTAGRNYGTPVESYERGAMAPDVYLPMISYANRNAEYGVDWVVEQLKACGVTLND